MPEITLETYDANIVKPIPIGSCYKWNSTDENTIGIKKLHIWKYEKTRGKITRGHFLWRVCGNDECLNENHWILDKYLSNKEKEEIRTRVDQGERSFDLAFEYGISLALLGNIRKGNDNPK